MNMEPAARAMVASFEILDDVSPWLIISFAAAGLLHGIVDPARFQRMLGNRKVSSLFKATISGMLLPICSCGVIPLGLGMYYTGAYLGPTLAFMVATPIINPVAILFAYGLLGPKIATIYVASGFALPILIGLVGNLLAGPEIQAAGVGNRINLSVLEGDACLPLRRKLLSGLDWGFKELGVMVSKYVVFGILLAGLIISLVPPVYIQRYLGSPGMISITGVAILGAAMYVCAVGHIPFIAALVASGAAPGVAITFLMSGAATNLPELISIFKMIGGRAVAIYAVMLIGLSMLIGLLTNRLLLPGFVPSFNLVEGRRISRIAGHFLFSAPDPLKHACSILVLALFLYSFWPRVRTYFAKAGER